MGENTPKLGPGKLVVATHNPGKLLEFNRLLGPYDIVAVSSGALGLPEPEETGKTFRENAAIKASAAAAAAGLPALADDSGLSVAALDGAPGVYSARWAGPEKDFGAAMAKVNNEVKAVGADDALASFVCVLCLVRPGAAPAFFEGTVEGKLVFPPRGDGGFGYDPIFAPAGENRTFAEMSADEKQALSHRGRAFAKFEATCLKPR